MFVTAYIIVFIYALTNYKSRVVFSTPDFLFEDSNLFMISNDSKKCRLRRADLGEVILNISHDIKFTEVARANPEVENGEWYRLSWLSSYSPAVLFDMPPPIPLHRCSRYV